MARTGSAVPGGVAATFGRRAVPRWPGVAGTAQRLRNGQVTCRSRGTRPIPTVKKAKKGWAPFPRFLVGCDTLCCTPGKRPEYRATRFSSVALVVGYPIMVRRLRLLRRL